MRPIRVLHCPEMVAGNAPQLARAERRIGLDSVSVALQQHAFGYSADEVLFADSDPAWLREAKRWRLLVRALREFDVVHFNFGSSILPAGANGGRTFAERSYRLYTRLVTLRDLPLLRRAGKGVVVTYQGDDARQGDVCLERFAITHAREVDADYYTREGDELRRRRVAVFSRYAHRIYALNPDLLHVLPTRAEFLPYAHIDLDVWRELPPPSNRRPVLVHAPSRRDIKGTRHVVAAVERLRRDGVEVELDLVEDVPNEEARRRYERADLAVDQLLAGWYGGFAVELMALGRPVVAYIREDDLAFVPEAMRAALPIVRATPDDLYDVLRERLAALAELRELGRRSAAYARAWHDPLTIAQRLAVAYRETLAEAA